MKMIILGAAAALVLSACASTNDVETEDESNTTPSVGESLSSSSPSPAPADDSGSVGLGEDIPSQVRGAMADLAAYLGVSTDVIDWISQEEVEWPDGSLGCPQPGMSYTQAVVNGSLIVFEVGGRSIRVPLERGS